MKKSLFGECLAEFIGTALLIFFGVGCVAALVVAGVELGQWRSIIWGLGVQSPYTSLVVFLVHLNPAVMLRCLKALISKYCPLSHKSPVHFVLLHSFTSYTAAYLLNLKRYKILYEAQ